jgi:hypothetical protein
VTPQEYSQCRTLRKAADATGVAGIGLAFATDLVAMSCFGATWKGKISDSACGASHAKMRAAHTDLASDKDCTLACIKSGSRYVLVSKGKIFQIDNQNLDDLQR